MLKIVERLAAIGVAFVFSFIIVAVYFGGTCVSYAWTIVPSQFHRLETAAEWARSDVEVSVEALDAWLDGNSSPEFAEAMPIKLERDPWGNPYRCIDLAAKGRSGSGFYSTGYDGVSHSAGDDPDDINSWSESPLDYYLRDARWRQTLMHFGAAALLTPVVYVFAGMVSACFAAIFRRERIDRVESAS